VHGFCLLCFALAFVSLLCSLDIPPQLPLPQTVFQGSTVAFDALNAAAASLLLDYLARPQAHTAVVAEDAASGLSFAHASPRRDSAATATAAALRRLRSPQQPAPTPARTPNDRAAFAATPACARPQPVFASATVSGADENSVTLISSGIGARTAAGASARKPKILSSCGDANGDAPVRTPFKLISGNKAAAGTPRRPWQ
jgi:hypothetical protein